MKFLALFVVLVMSVAGIMLWQGNQETTPPREPSSQSVASPEATQTPATTPGSEEQPKTTERYTVADVAKHADRSSCWTIVRGQVYDVTSAIDQHPGGADKILGMCGKDATAQFVGKHGGMEKQEAMLTSMGIGTLDEAR